MLAAVRPCEVSPASGVAVTPNGQSVYVTNQNGNSISVIDPATNTVTSTIAVGSHPIGIAATPDSASIYATNSGSNTVSVITVATNTVATTIPVDQGPYGIAIASIRTIAPPSISMSILFLNKLRSHRLAAPSRFFNPTFSFHLTIMTVQGQCSLTRSVVLPSKKRAMRECPCCPSTTRSTPSVSA